VCGLLVGITATRAGATPAQLDALLALLLRADVQELHHGDCLGGDADADGVACGLGIFRVAHPPSNPKLRAFCRAERVLPPEEYKARDRAIVRAAGVLVAMPRTAAEQRFGGTWYTVGHARLAGRPVVIINPDGTLRAERTHGHYFGL